MSSNEVINIKWTGNANGGVEAFVSYYRLAVHKLYRPHHPTILLGTMEGYVKVGPYILSLHVTVTKCNTVQQVAGVLGGELLKIVEHYGISQSRQDYIKQCTRLGIWPSSIYDDSGLSTFPLDIGQDIRLLPTR